MTTTPMTNAARLQTLRDRASKLGLDITTGAYTGTSDDRAGRYYIERRDSSVVDRRGAGYTLDGLDEAIAEQEHWAQIDAEHDR